MGQSVKDAFGIDLSSLSVERLCKDSHLCEHVRMACLVETTALGKEFHCGDDAESVYACAKELFGGVRVQDFLHEVLCGELCGGVTADCRRRLTWLCGFLEYVSRRLGVDTLPRGVSVEWFFDEALLWVENTYVCGNLDRSFSDDDYEWVFLRLLYYSEWFFSYRCDKTMTKLSAVGWSKLCLGASRFRDFEIRASWGVLKHSESPTEGVSLDTLIAEVCDSKYSAGPHHCGRADAVLGLLLQMFLGVRFLALNYDLFDFEMLDKFTALVKSPMYLNTGFSDEPARLYVYCANTFLMRYDGYDCVCMGYVEPHIFVEGDFTDICDTLRESNIYLLRDVSFSYLNWGSHYYWDSDPYFGISGVVTDWFEKKKPLREWRVLSYDSQTLKRDVVAQLKVEGTPLGIVDADVTEMCGYLETPLIGQRRITMDLFKFYYPDGVRAACCRNFMGFPLVLWLEGLGVYYVVDDYLMLLPFDYLYSQAKGYWGCKCPIGADDVRDMKLCARIGAHIDDFGGNKLRSYGLNFYNDDYLTVHVCWGHNPCCISDYRFRGDLSEVESWESVFSK